MQTSKSIQIPKRVDPRRKLLIKQLQNCIKKQNIITPKRLSTQQYNEYETQDKLKKKQHIDMNVLKDRKQNEKVNKQNDRIITNIKQKQIPIKPQSSHYSSSQQNKTQNLLNFNYLDQLNQLPHINYSGLTQMLDQKLVNFGLTMSDDLNVFTQKERLLISIQQKMDSYLSFVKENRKKKKGEFFKVLKKYFLENYRIFIEFTHVKKIIYIDQNLYTIQKAGEGIDVDCLIDIKFQIREENQKSLQFELKDRKTNFRAKLFAFKQTHKNLFGEQDEIEIPQVKFQFEETLQGSKDGLKKSLKSLFDGQLMNKKKIDKFFVLSNKNSAVYKDSKKILTKGIKKVQKIIKKQNEIDLSLFVNKMFQKKQLNPKQIQSIIDEISIVYRNKNVTNMAQVQLIEGLSKKLILAQKIIKKVIQNFIQISAQINKDKCYLKQIQHKSGRIIQMNKNFQKQFKILVTSRTDLMSKFEFQVEMSDQYVKKKLQQERQKVYKQVTQEAIQDLEQQKIKQYARQQKDKINGISTVQKKNQLMKICFADDDIRYDEYQQESKKEDYDNKAQSLKTANIERLLKQQSQSPRKDEFKSTLSNEDYIFEQVQDSQEENVERE